MREACARCDFGDRQVRFPQQHGGSFRAQAEQILMDRQSRRFLKRCRETATWKTCHVRELFDGPLSGKVFLHSAEKFAEFGMEENARALRLSQTVGRDEKGRHNQA